MLYSGSIYSLFNHRALSSHLNLKQSLAKSKSRCKMYKSTDRLFSYRFPLITTGTNHLALPNHTRSTPGKEKGREGQTSPTRSVTASTRQGDQLHAPASHRLRLYPPPLSQQQYQLTPQPLASHTPQHYSQHRGVDKLAVMNTIISCTLKKYRVMPDLRANNYLA